MRYEAHGMGSYISHKWDVGIVSKKLCTCNSDVVFGVNRPSVSKVSMDGLFYDKGWVNREAPLVEF